MAGGFAAKVTLLFVYLGGCLCQRDCGGMDCPLLDGCIEEVLESGSCCATCLQKGCTCEGYQYYDCISAGFKNGKVPEGHSYFVDYGSTECSCPEGGGPISCSFISCPDLPPNCIKVSEPADGCMTCERIGCVQGTQKYEAGHSFHADPCRVCHCPHEGGRLMCYPVPDCDPNHVQAAPTRVTTRPPTHETLPLFKSTDNEEAEDYYYGPTDFQETHHQSVVFPTQSPPADQETSASHSTSALLHFDRQSMLERGEQGRAGDPDREQTTVNPRTTSSPLPTRGRTIDANAHVDFNRLDTRTETNKQPHIHSGTLHLQSSSDIGVLSGTESPVRVWGSHTDQQSPSDTVDFTLHPETPTHPRAASNGQIQLELDKDTTYLQNVTGPEGSDGVDSIRSAQQESSSPARNREKTTPASTAAPGQHTSQTTPAALFVSSSQRPTGGGREESEPSTNSHRRRLNGGDQERMESKEERKHPPVLLTETYTGPRTPPEDLLSRCCAAGRRWAAEHHHCKDITLLEDKQRSTCSVAQVQCCLGAVRDFQCASGVSSARRGVACDGVTEDQCSHDSYQVCCSCCALGLRMRSEGKGCDSHHHLGYPCGHVFLTCCGEDDGQSQVLVWSEQKSRPAGMPIEVSADEDKKLSEDETPAVFPTTQTTLTPAPTTITTTTTTSGPVLLNPCAERGVCSQQCAAVAGQAHCSCFSGFALQADGHTCEDINECALGTHNCGAAFVCQNTVGFFLCNPKDKCISGFTQDSYGNCIDINECSSLPAPCSSGYNCINTVGSYSCQQKIIKCSHGYRASMDGGKCVDIDECQLGVHRCGVGQICHNLAGSYRCDCQTGYQYDALRKVCTDINECWHSTGRLCAQTCENTAGSYRCSCTAGFSLASDGKSCEDINECDKKPCNQECTNIYGSYQCYCRQGYFLKEDGHMCEDIDECSQSTRNLCAFQCVNVLGSYRCSCPPHGYVTSANGHTCKDIDECATETHNCSYEQTCYNLRGGFRCLSYDCPYHYKKVSDTRCERTTCPMNSFDCQNLPVSITYHQLSFQTNSVIPAQIFRIGPSPAYAGDHITVSITKGNEEGYFNTRKVSSFTGAVYLQRQVRQPRDFLIDVEMKLLRQGTFTSFLSRIYVFITSSV